MEWKTIKSFPDYEVSPVGGIRNAKTLRELKPQTSLDGYLHCTLIRGGKKHTVKMHRPVAEEFIVRPNGCSEVAHNNGIRYDNRLENLRWDTRTGNQKDRLKHGTHNRGERGACAKFTNMQSKEIKAAYASGASRMALARQHSVSYETIRAMCAGETYRETT